MLPLAFAVALAIHAWSSVLLADPILGLSDQTFSLDGPELLQFLKAEDQERRDRLLAESLAAAAARSAEGVKPGDHAVGTPLRAISPIDRPHYKTLGEMPLPLGEPDADGAPSFMISGRPTLRDADVELTATKGDIDALNKRLDHLEGMIRCQSAVLGHAFVGDNPCP
jgi:hypothetical protein